MVVIQSKLILLNHLTRCIFLTSTNLKNQMKIQVKAVDTSDVVNLRCTHRASWINSHQKSTLMTMRLNLTHYQDRQLLILQIFSLKTIFRASLIKMTQMLRIRKKWKSEKFEENLNDFFQNIKFLVIEFSSSQQTNMKQIMKFKKK